MGGQKRTFMCLFREWGQVDGHARRKKVCLPLEHLVGLCVDVLKSFRISLTGGGKLPTA